MNPVSVSRSHLAHISSPITTNIINTKCNSAEVTLNMLNAPQEHGTGSDDLSNDTIRHNFNCDIDMK